MEKILQSYLWATYGGARGLPLVPPDICIMTKDEGGLGLIGVASWKPNGLLYVWRDVSHG